MEPLLEVHKGTSRIVLTSRVFPNFALKVSRIQVYKGLDNMLRLAEAGLWKEIFKGRTWRVCSQLMNPAWYLYKGIAENWREAGFYKKRDIPPYSRHFFHFGDFSTFRAPRALRSKAIQTNSGKE